MVLRISKGKSSYFFFHFNIFLTAILFVLTRSLGLTSPPQSFADIVEPLIPSIVNISTISDGLKNKKVSGNGFNYESTVKGFLRPFSDDEEGLLIARRSHSLGSGFVISQKGDDVFIVTCAHVIQGADEIRVIFNDNSEAKSEVVGRDRRTDLAVLRVKTRKMVSVAQWGDSRKSRPGDWLIAIGNPFGLSSTVTIGVISSIARDLASRIRAFNDPMSDYIDGYIQTDASINMGNSGGPMFDISGKVIGISTAIFSTNGGNIGIGFSIPSDVAKNVVDQLCRYGKIRRGWIGIRVQNVGDKATLALGLPESKGALIGEVSPSGPASKAGMRRGDVILSFGGVNITESRSLPRVVGDSIIGQRIPIVIWRQGHKETLVVTVGEYEEHETSTILSDGSNGMSHKCQTKDNLVRV